MSEPLSDDGEIHARLRRIEERIEAAGGRRAVGDPSHPSGVHVLAVTKTRSDAVVRAARGAGLVDVGENYAQELEAKAGMVDDVRWHMIGGIQRNKVRRLAEVVWLWQSVDRPAVVDELAKRAPGARILVQIRPDGEEDHKAGCSLSEAGPLIDRAVANGLSVLGAMTVGPTDAAVDPRPAFAAVRAFVDRLDLPICSMGMSRDLEAAVEEGSTMVRVGTDLFGPRVSPTDGHGQ